MLSRVQEKNDFEHLKYMYVDLLTKKFSYL